MCAAVVAMGRRLGGRGRREEVGGVSSEVPLPPRGKPG